MSSISSIGGLGSSTPLPNAPQVKDATIKQAAVAASKVAAPAALPAGAHRNGAGDTVNLSGIVLVDHDGDGGVGQPAPKAKAPATSVQQLLANTYSAH